jgi:isopenicillin N synthase-like dioxygenase
MQFDECAQSLESNGYALLPLSADLVSSISNAFATAREALDSVSSSIDGQQSNVPLIDPNSDSGSWTGYHRANVQNGRYNQFREGFVFSNGDMFDVDRSLHGNDADGFRREMNELFHVMHNVISNGVLEAIEKRLHLPQFYFRNELGPMETSSQWHLKRYDIHSPDLIDQDLDQEPEILPMHTDPSLISVVLLDRPGINMGCMGLQVYQSEESMWKEIDHHGHDIAIIFVGSVLSHLTKRHVFPAAKHRVVQWWPKKCTDDNRQRVAATLFVRPYGDALMKPLSDDSDKRYQTFRQWNQRVARNYIKSKGQKR